MIPAARGHVVRSKRTSTKGTTYWSTERVLAWDDDWYPLIAGASGLQRAGAGYELDEEDVYSVVIPGGGWLETGTLDDGTSWTRPVLAWRIDANGYGEPICVDGEGGAEPVKLDSKTTYDHPDAKW